MGIDAAERVGMTVEYVEWSIWKNRSNFRGALGLMCIVQNGVDIMCGIFLFCIDAHSS